MKTKISESGFKEKTAARRCADAGELQAVVRLVSSVLAANQADPYKRFKHDFKLYGIKPSGSLILTGAREDILATLTILKRKVNLFGRKVDVAGVAFVCVRPDYQGAGLGRVLMDFAVEELKKRKEVLSVLIARRAVDGFYQKFGYLGTGCFTELAINLGASGNTAGSKGAEFTFEPVEGEAHRYARFYSDLYEDLPFSFVRGIKWWKDVRSWLQYKIEPARFVNVFYKGKLAGYFIHKDNVVAEAACAAADIDSFCDALLGFMRDRGFSELILTVSAKHACSRRLQRLNHTLRQRRAWNGGHMMRIMDRDKFHGLIGSYIERKYSRIFNAALVKQSLESIEQTLKRFDSADNDDVRDMLFEIVNGRSNPILKDVGAMFKHSWSDIDCF